MAGVNNTGKLRENEAEPFSHSSKGSGPRHMVFHPNNVAAYTINEKDSTIDSFSYHASGRLRRERTVSTLPDDFKGESFCAEIKVSPDGRHVYGSNRAVEPAFSTIVVYRVVEDASAPKATALGRVAFSIDSISWPRGMSLSPSGRHMIVANQKGRYLLVLIYIQ